MSFPGEIQGLSKFALLMDALVELKAEVTVL